MKKATLILILFLVPVLSPAQDGGGGGYLSKKADDKKASRWTLADWLSQKERVRAMDYWLAMNTSVHPFEFYLEGSYLKPKVFLGATPEETTYWTEYEGVLGAYATIAGLVAEYDKTVEEEDWTNYGASFNLRLYGAAVQGTNITLYYGLSYRSYEPDEDDTVITKTETFENNFAGVSMALYFTDYFGIDGDYRKILLGNSTEDRKLQGERSRAGIFIDFSFLRIFGYWRKELLIFDQTTTQVREGMGGGIRLFF